VTTDFGADEVAGGVAIQPDGNIVVAGTSYPSLNEDIRDFSFVLARYLGDRPNVTSLPNAITGTTVTLESAAGSTLAGVQAVTDPPVLYMPTGTTVNQYWKYGVGGWFNFGWDGTTGAQFQDVNGDGTKDVVLTFVDGQRGDADGIANGVIVDPGAPVLMPRQVQIDIKPGDGTNSTNLAGQGNIAVALLSTADFNAALVDVGSVRFAGAAAVQWALEDVNGDGRLDMVLHFRTQDTNLRALYEQLLADDIDADGVLDSSRQTATIALTGSTTDDELFEGWDYIDLFLSGKALRDLLDELAATGAI
jgi:hypothetical protein